MKNISNTFTLVAIVVASMALNRAIERGDTVFATVTMVMVLVNSAVILIKLSK